MRLTNIARVALPDGALHVLTTRPVGEPVREVPVSFDQRRHVGEGDRAGSWMALAFEVPDAADLVAFERAWMRVVARHGALRTVFAEGDAGLRLRETDLTSGGWWPLAVPPGVTIRDALHHALDAQCRPFARPSHLLAAVVPDAGPPTLVIASDHAHVDMWSLLVLARDLLDETRGSVDAPDDFGTHSAVLEALPPAPERVTSRWRDILHAGGGRLPVFPLPLGDVDAPRPEVVEVRDVLDDGAAERFEAVAADAGVRPTALALSVLARVTRDLAGAPLRAVFPVHSRSEPRWLDSVGWFITNSVIECEDADPRAVAASVREAMALGSHPLAPILGPAGPPPAPGMFAISWLDTRRLPAVEGARSIQFISAAIKTDGVMIWFILNATGLHLRCRYPDTPEARANVGRWLDAVESGIRAHAAASVAVTE
jgi:mycolipenoyl-CoA---2-(long-chain-fatty acyl)-trehalose mycolipenoyltransferase / long-chain-acyl-CoA---trehalose acyltransferase